MKNVSKYIVYGGLLGVGLLFGATACTDDHFDIQQSAPTTGQSIWRNIKGAPELSDFAELLEKTPVAKSKIHKGNKQTFAQLLDQPQQFTVWAPLNGTFDKQHYLDLLSQAQQARQDYQTSHEKADSLRALELEYEVASQFAGNHIARFNYESSAARQQIRMFNNKLCFYDPAEGTFNGIGLASLSDIENALPPTGGEPSVDEPSVAAAQFAAGVSAANGSIHILKEASPFAYNIYDFLSANADQFSKVYGTIVEKDDTRFDANASIPGTINPDGEMEYVDSVYTTTNALLASSNASITNEDSLYIAIIPSDNAWEEGVAKIGELYKYREHYNYEWSNVSGEFTKFDFNINEHDRDSIQQYRAQTSMFQSMFITPASMRGMDRSNPEAMLQYALTADSLVTTTGLVLYNKANMKADGGFNEFSGEKHLNPIFAGVTPQKASNGYILALPSYSIDPAYSFQQKNNVFLYYQNNIPYTNALNQRLMTLDDKSRNKEITGEVKDNQYALFQLTEAKGNLEFYVALRGLQSGKYKISIEVLPNYISNAYAQTNFVPKEEEKVDENGDPVLDAEGEPVMVPGPQKPTFRAQIFDFPNTNNGKATILAAPDGSKNRTVSASELPQEQISIVTLWDEFEFADTYSQLPDNKESFPVLQIYVANRSMVAGKFDALSFGRVIIEPIRD